MVLLAPIPGRGKSETGSTPALHASSSALPCVSLRTVSKNNFPGSSGGQRGAWANRKRIFDELPMLLFVLRMNQIGKLFFETMLNSHGSPRFDGFYLTITHYQRIAS